MQYIFYKMQKSIDILQNAIYNQSRKEEYYMTNEQNKLLSDIIKLQRFKIQKSQEDCSKELNISIPTYRELEKNPKKLDLDQLIILSKYLNFNFAEFFLNIILQNAI